MNVGTSKSVLSTVVNVSLLVLSDHCTCEYLSLCLYSFSGTKNKVLEASEAKVRQVSWQINHYQAQRGPNWKKTLYLFPPLMEPPIRDPLRCIGTTSLQRTLVAAPR